VIFIIAVLPDNQISPHMKVINEADGEWPRHDELCCEVVPGRDSCDVMFVGGEAGR
jgi:hypothetical protein